MRWWGRRMRRSRLAEARGAVESARQALADSQQRAPEAHDLAARLRRLRAENHFAGSLEAMVRAGYEGGHRGAGS